MAATRCLSGATHLQGAPLGVLLLHLLLQPHSPQQPRALSLQGLHLPLQLLRLLQAGTICVPHEPRKQHPEQGNVQSIRAALLCGFHFAARHHTLCSMPRPMRTCPYCCISSAALRLCARRRSRSASKHSSPSTALLLSSPAASPSESPSNWYSRRCSARTCTGRGDTDDAYGWWVTPACLSAQPCHTCAIHLLLTVPCPPC